MFEFEIVRIRPISTKRIAKISIQKYEVTYKSLLKTHTVVIELLKYNSRKAIIVNDSFSTHSDFINYLAERMNLPIITPNEIPRFVSNP